MSSEMPDSTRELLNAHHASLLRELSGVSASIVNLRQNMREDSDTVREKLDVHGTMDNQRFSTIDNSLSVLKWAYGLAAAIAALVFAKMQWF